MMSSWLRSEELASTLALALDSFGAAKSAACGGWLSGYGQRFIAASDCLLHECDVSATLQST